MMATLAFNELSSKLGIEVELLAISFREKKIQLNDIFPKLYHIDIIMTPK